MTGKRKKKMWMHLTAWPVFSTDRRYKTDEGQVWEVPRSYDGFSCSSTSDVTENVGGRDETSFSSVV